MADLIAEDATCRHVVTIAEAAGKTLGEIEGGFEVPEDLIERLGLFVERCANALLGVAEAGKYTLFVWTLRKITKEHLNAMYPALKADEDKRRAVFEALGIREDRPLFIPAVRSP